MLALDSIQPTPLANEAKAEEAEEHASAKYRPWTNKGGRNFLLNWSGP